MTATWRDALDEKIDLHRYWQSPAGARAARAFGQSMVAVEREVGGAIEYASWYAQRIAQIEASKALFAEPIVVEAPMMDLIDAAAGTFLPEPLHEHDLITRNGFLRFPRPLIMLDRHNKRVTFRIVMWSPWFNETSNEVGVSLSLYSHVDDMLGGLDDYGPHEIAGADASERELEWAAQVLRGEHSSPYRLAHVTMWAFGETYPHEQAGQPTRSEDSWWAHVQAAFRLCQQTIASRTTEHPDRHARKRSFRTAPQSPTDVTVITLRRPRNAASGETSGVEWQHSWIVNGHWRNQPYPSLGVHRQRWISPYAKGPEDKPLLVKQGRVFRLAQ